MADESKSSGAAIGEATPRPRLLDQVREVIRLRYFSRRTEESYVHWNKGFIYFHCKRHRARRSVPA